MDGENWVESRIKGEQEEGVKERRGSVRACSVLVMPYSCNAHQSLRIRPQGEGLSGFLRAL